MQHAVFGSRMQIECGLKPDVVDQMTKWAVRDALCKMPNPPQKCLLPGTDAFAFHVELEENQNSRGLARLQALQREQQAGPDIGVHVDVALALTQTNTSHHAFPAGDYEHADTVMQAAHSASSCDVPQHHHHHHAQQQQQQQPTDVLAGANSLSFELDSALLSSNNPSSSAHAPFFEGQSGDSAEGFLPEDLAATSDEFGGEGGEELSLELFNGLHGDGVEHLDDIERERERNRKAELRKQRNREAAQRSNRKRKLKNDTLKSDLKKWHQQAAHLRAKELRLREENIRLRRLLSS